MNVQRLSSWVSQGQRTGAGLAAGLLSEGRVLDFSNFSDLQLYTFSALCWLVLLPVLQLQNFLTQVLTFVRFAVMDLRKQMEAQHFTLRSHTACNVIQALQTILENFGMAFRFLWLHMQGQVKAGQIVTNSSQATSGKNWTALEAPPASWWIFVGSVVALRLWV